MKNVLFVIKTLLTKGKENQSFIGAVWLATLLQRLPSSLKRGAALRALALSPHYFYRDINSGYANLSKKEFLEREFERNKESRIKLRDQILAPYLHENITALDYGCGPGFLANAVSEQVAQVTALDVSKGVIECARILNQRSNIEFIHTDEIASLDNSSQDLIYSFAVIQHVTDEVLKQILSNTHRLLKDQGKLVFHVVVDQDDWREENEWQADSSVSGRLKLEYGLNCFGRDSQTMLSMFEKHGFEQVRLEEIEALCPDNFDDICRQHLITALKPSDEN